MALTDAELEWLDRLEKAATQGPWSVYVGAADLHILATGDPQPVASLADFGVQLRTHDADAALIVEARNALSGLIDDLRDRRAALRRVSELADELIAAGFVTLYETAQECGEAIHRAVDA